MVKGKGLGLGSGVGVRVGGLGLGLRLGPGNVLLLFLQNVVKILPSGNTLAPGCI